MTAAGHEASRAERRALVIVVSTSAAAGEAEDRTGPVIRDWLAERGFAVGEPGIVADGPPLGERLREAVRAEPELIITTGGTGLSPDDRTPEETAELLDVTIPGIAEEIRRSAADRVPTSILSRGLAGFAASTMILNLPGSPGGVRDGLAVLDRVLDHALEQHGGEPGAGHPRR